MAPLFSIKLLRRLTVLHLVLAGIFLPLAIYGSLASFPADTPDFVAYYAATVVMSHSPAELYRSPAYSELYTTLLSLHSTPYTNFRFMYSPPVALVIWPLHWFSYKQAYLVWCAINAAVILLIARKAGQLAIRCGFTEAVTFFQSCVLGLVMTALAFWLGQVSLILCLCLFCLLLEMERGHPAKAALWYVVMLLIKPQLFVFIGLYFLGAKQWRFIACAAAGYFGCFALSTIILGFNVWIDYVTFLVLLVRLPPWIAIAGALGGNATEIISLKGILAAVFVPGSFVLTKLPAPLFALFNIGCLVAGYVRRHSSGVQDICLLTPWCFLASTYLLSHDIVLLLPVGIVLARLMAERGKVRWMLLPYVLGSYLIIIGGMHFYMWSCRLLIVSLCTISGYIFLTRADDKQSALHAARTVP